MSTLKVVLVKFRPDPRALRHGYANKVEYQAKIEGANSKTKWLGYSHKEKRFPKREAEYWAGLLGVEVEEVDITDGWGKEI